MIFDEQGYCKLADFGMSRIWQEYNMSDTSGHPGYIAPEVLLREKHGLAADYFAVGVVAHELMLRKRPWDGETRETYKKAVLHEQITLKKNVVPESWCQEAADFINKCIKRKTE
jgi:serine/threonine protein kinase